MNTQTARLISDGQTPLTPKQLESADRVATLRRQGFTGFADALEKFLKDDTSDRYPTEAALRAVAVEAARERRRSLR